METNDNTIKTSRKHPMRIFLRALRWLGIIVLSGLVIAGLYVQAPWKITALCAVMLAGLTIIYGRLRIIFWLGFAVVAIGVGVWILIPEKDDGQWQRWPLDEEIAAFNARFAIPPEDNAATIYDALLEARDWDEISERLRQADPEDKAQAGLWDDDLPELAGLLVEIAPELEQLRIAVLKPMCYFQINPSIYELSEQMGRLSTMRRWSILLHIRSFQHTHAQPIEDCIAIVRMGEYLCAQPTILDILVGLAIHNLGIHRLKGMIVNEPLSDEQLNRIEQAIERSPIDIEARAAGILDYEKLFTKAFFGMMYQKHPSGRVRPMRLSYLLEQWDIEDAEQEPTTYWGKVQEKLLVAAAWFALPLRPAPLFRKIDTVYEPLYAFPPSKEHVNPFYVSFETHYNAGGYIADSAASTLSTMSTLAHSIVPRQECERSGVLLLCHLRRYRVRHQQWPESLEELLPDTPEERLIDPVSGERFVYERSDDDFVLYSTGMETWGFDLDDFSRTKEHKIIEIWP